MVRDEQGSERDERKRGKETVKATERWNRGSGKVRVRQMTARVKSVYVYVCVYVSVCWG